MSPFHFRFLPPVVFAVLCKHKCLYGSIESQTAVSQGMAKYSDSIFLPYFKRLSMVSQFPEQVWYGQGDVQG